MSNKIDLHSLNIQIPNHVFNYTLEIQEEISHYLSNLDEQHKIAYNIALEHLGSSFDIYRSNGFKDWKQKNCIK
jgi:hypothetical protein